VKELYNTAQCCGAAYDSVFGLLAKDEDLSSLTTRVSLLEKASSEVQVSGDSKRKFTLVNYTALEDETILAKGDPSNFNNRIYLISAFEMKDQIDKVVDRYTTSEIRYGGKNFQIVVRFYPMEVLKTSALAYALKTGGKAKFLRSNDDSYFLEEIIEDEYGSPHFTLASPTIVSTWLSQGVVRSPFTSVDLSNFQTAESSGLPLTRGVYSFVVNTNTLNSSLLNLDASIDDMISSFEAFESASGLKAVSMGSQYLFPFGALWQIIFMRRWGVDKFDSLMADTTGTMWNGSEVVESITILRRFSPHFTDKWYKRSLFYTLNDFAGNMGTFARGEEGMIFFDVALLNAFSVPASGLAYKTGFQLGHGHDTSALSFNGDVLSSTYSTLAEKERDLSVAQIFASSHVGSGFDFPANTISQSKSTMQHIKDYSGSGVLISGERTYFDRIVAPRLGYEITSYLIDSVAFEGSDILSHLSPLVEVVRHFYDSGTFVLPRASSGEYVPTVT
jgi:hypothetical protein